MAVFADRKDAGRLLAARLEFLRGDDVVILGLPRGGVPVAFEVAQALDAPLDVIVVRKLGLPFEPELAMGAIGEGGTRVLDAQVLRHAQVREEELEAVETHERGELEMRVGRLRRGRERIDLHGRVAVVVDDGVATGSTARVACQVARNLGAAMVVLRRARGRARRDGAVRRCGSGRVRLDARAVQRRRLLLPRLLTYVRRGGGGAVGRGHSAGESPPPAALITVLVDQRTASARSKLVNARSHV